MTMYFSVILTVFIILASVEEGFGLKCLQCKSENVDGRCRLGQRSNFIPKRQSCFGKNAKCYALATVTEIGEPTFERGCTTKNICDELAEAGIEFCFTCRSTFCNYNVMELEKEVEDYLREVAEYEKALTSTTTTTTTSTTQSPLVKPKRKHMFSSSRHNSYKNGLSASTHSQQNLNNSNIVELKPTLPDHTIEKDEITTEISAEKSSISTPSVSNKNNLQIPEVSNQGNQVGFNDSYHNITMVHEKIQE